MATFWVTALTTTAVLTTVNVVVDRNREHLVVGAIAMSLWITAYVLATHLCWH